MALPNYKELNEIFDHYLSKARPRLAVGTIKNREGLLEGLKEASIFADIHLVGINLDGYDNCSPTEKPIDKMVSMLKNGEVDGIVKIHVDGIILRNTYRDAFGFDHVNRASLINTKLKLPKSSKREERTFMLYPFSLEEGDSIKQRTEGILEVVEELKWIYPKKTKVGLLTLSRDKTAFAEGTHEKARKSFEEAAIISRLLMQDSNIEAKDFFKIEDAIKECDIVSPYRGDHGMILYSSVNFFGETIEIASPACSNPVYVGGSRNVDNVVIRLKYAAAKCAWLRSSTNNN